LAIVEWRLPIVVLSILLYALNLVAYEAFGDVEDAGARLIGQSGEDALGDFFDQLLVANGATR